MITAYIIVGIVCLVIGFRLGMRYERGLFVTALDVFAKHLMGQINQAGTCAEAEKIVRDFAKKRGLR